MIGYLRLFFALIVMAEHLGPEWWWAYHFGHWAVRGFFVISGYFAAASLSKGVKPWPFMQGRMVRIFPCYWVALALSLTLIWGWDLTEFHPMMIPPSLPELAKNAGLWVEYGKLQSFPVVQAWALPVILFWNGVMSLGLFATARHSILGIALLWALNQSMPLSYFSVLAGGLPFAVGALLWQCQMPIPNSRGRWPTLSAELSYPVFLTHYTVGAGLWLITGTDRGWPLFFAALGPTMALSWLLVVAVERPVQHYRQRLRQHP